PDDDRRQVVLAERRRFGEDPERPLLELAFVMLEKDQGCHREQLEQLLLRQELHDHLGCGPVVLDLLRSAPCGWIREPVDLGTRPSMSVISAAWEITGRRNRSATAAQSTAPSESLACCPNRTRSGSSRSTAAATT